MLNEKKFKEKLNTIEFSDISNKFPKEYLTVDYEPLYSVFHTLNKQCVCFLDENYRTDKKLVNCLNNLFIKETLAEKKEIYFSDFNGVNCTSANEFCSFESFMQEQYERNKDEQKYSDYETVKYEVFNTVSPVDSNPLKGAIILTWSNKIYANTSNKSHRFALMCKMNELENRNDSYYFDITKYTLNENAKKEFLENYYGFIIKAETANKIIQASSDNSLMTWEFYRPYWKSINDDVIAFIFRKEKNYHTAFLKSENAICINTLLDS